MLVAAHSRAFDAAVCWKLDRLALIWTQGNDQDLGQRVRFISSLAVRSRDNRHGVPAFERLLAFL
jgi:hypothetical protein